MENNKSNYSVFYLILLLFAMANSGVAQFEKKEQKPIFVVLTNGDTIFGNRLTHFGWGNSGWVKVRDTLGKKHKIFDMDYKYYNYKGNYYYSLKAQNRNKRSDYWVFGLYEKGSFDVYFRDHNDRYIYYLVHDKYRGFVGKKLYKEQLLPILENCEAYCRAFPPEDRVFGTWLMQVKVFNRLCK